MVAANGGPRRSQRLRLSQVVAAGRLVAEVRERGDDPLAWRRHLLLGLNRLVGARLSSALERVVIAGPSGAGRWAPERLLGVVSVGYADEVERLRHAAAVDASRTAGRDLGWEAAAPLAGRAFTRSRGQLVADRDWYRSDHARVACLNFGVDSFIRSELPVRSAGRVHYLSLTRPPGDRPFSPGECRLVALVHSELGRVWRRHDRATLVGDDADPTVGLPPRLRQTLILLRAGRSQKQVAADLGLSAYTVHDYAKALHHRFGAETRAELLSRTNPPKPKWIPRLSPDA